VACICGGDNEMSCKGATTGAVSTSHELRLLIWKSKSKPQLEVTLRLKLVCDLN